MDTLFYPKYIEGESSDDFYSFTNCDLKTQISKFVVPANCFGVYHIVSRNHRLAIDWKGAIVRYHIYKLWKKVYQAQRYMIQLRRLLFEKRHLFEKNKRQQQQHELSLKQAKLQKFLTYLKTMFVDFELCYKHVSECRSLAVKNRSLDTLRTVMFNPV